MPKKLKHKDTGDTDTQTTQAQSTDGQGTEAQGTEDQSRGEQARPYLKNASYPAGREDLAATIWADVQKALDLDAPLPPWRHVSSSRPFRSTSWRRVARL